MPLDTKRLTAMRLDVGLEPVDLGLEILELDHQAVPLELDQTELGLGVEEVLGGLVGAFAGGGDLTRGSLGRVLVGLRRDAGLHRQQREQRRDCYRQSPRRAHTRGEC